MQGISDNVKFLVTGGVEEAARLVKADDIGVSAVVEPQLSLRENGSLEHLRVIHYCPLWLPRTQTWIYNQVRYLPDDIETHIVCERVNNLAQFKLPRIHCLADVPRLTRFVDQRIRWMKIRRHLSFVAAAARETGSEIFHSHFGPNAWETMGALNRTRTKHVVSFYGYDVTLWPRQHPEYIPRYRELFDNVAAVFCEGSVMAGRLVDLGCPGEKVIIQHLGIPLDRIPYRPRLWRRGTPLRVLISASFKEKKGIPYAIRALGEIRREVDLELTIIGDAGARDSDVAEKAKILSALDEAGLAGVTRMMGFQPYSKLLEEAKCHHIFVSPSVTASNGDTEGGAPVTIIEMAASGMPIVSSMHCDIPEVVLNGETGWLAPEKDWRLLAEHLRWLVKHPDDWRPFLDASRQRVEEEYNCRTQGIRLAQHYARLAALS